jgi:hypothetical protein
MREEQAMAATSINCLAIVLKELGWSYTKLIAEHREPHRTDQPMGQQPSAARRFLPRPTEPGDRKASLRVVQR